MKRRFTYILGLSLLMIQSAFAQIPSNGLVGQWTFNSGNANDEIASVNGTVTGATLTTDRFGNTDHAYQFASAGTYIGFGDTFDEYLATTGSGTISYSFWVTFDVVNGTNQVILAKVSDSGCSENGRQILIRLNANNHIEVLAFGVLSTGNYVAVEGSTTVQAGTWYHVAVTYDEELITQVSSAASLNIFVNGQAETMNTSLFAGNQLTFYPGIANGNAHLGIGVSLSSTGAPCNTSSYLQGKFDDLRIYSSVLSPTNIQALYNEIDVMNVVAMYDFNDGTADDHSGNGLDATAVSTTTTTDRFGNPDAAFHFDGSTSLVNLPDGILLHQQMSISLWFKTANPGGLIGYQSGAYPASGSNYVPIAYVGSDNTLYATFWQGFVTQLNTNPAAMNDDQWHHMVITGTVSGQQLYIDNVLAGTGNGISILSSMIKGQLGVAQTGGGWPNGSNGWFFFDGDIDDVSIYHRQLNASEVNELYTVNNPLTGISSASKENGISIYPNPANDVLNIRSTTPFTQVTMTDVAGRLVMSRSGSGLNSMDLSHFDRGIYFLQFADDNQVIATQKVVLR